MKTQKEWDEIRVELSVEFGKHLLNSAEYFKEEFWNWNHLQEEFEDAYETNLFLNEIINGVLEDFIERGGMLS